MPDRKPILLALLTGAAWASCAPPSPAAPNRVRPKAAPASYAGSDRLLSGFRNPPDSAKPHTWWHWVNGNVTKAGITADLEAMKRVGIGGAQIFNVDVGIPAGKAPFMSAEWRGMIQHAAKEADRLGIELCVHNCAGWSSSGGPWVTPQYSMQVLTSSEKAVEGPSTFNDVLPQPESRQDYYEDIAVLAFPTPGGSGRIADIGGKAYFNRGGQSLPDLSASIPSGSTVPRSEIVNLTGKMGADGRLNWDVPAGNWTILRVGHTTTGAVNAPAPTAGRGLEVDKLSREAMDYYWDHGMMAEVLKDVGPLAGKSINNALIDSYEVGSQNWTPKFREEFTKRRGYDPLPYLPVAMGHVVESDEVSERFLWDFRRTIADLMAENYFGYFGELCRKHGLKFSTEPYGNGPFDNLQAGGTADIPMGEFWVGGGTLETLKLASSIGHTNGRTVVGAESFTADDQRGRWLVDPYSVKALGDYAFSRGINRYIFHRYAMQPWLDVKPGMTMGPWGTHFERTVTWWNQSTAWLSYVARCQYLLQSGKFAADVLYFTGESAPNDLPDRAGLRPEMPDGYDYDGCDYTVLLRRLSVKNGRLVLPDGMSYRALALPENTFMTPQVLRKVRELVRDGATVVGPKPKQSPSLTDFPNGDAEVQQIADEVWGNGETRAGSHVFGKGTMYWGVPLQKILRGLITTPDFTYAGAKTGVRLAEIHRIADGADLYFVSNQQYRPLEVECSFRGIGRIPELWHPDTGKSEAAPVYRTQGGRTVVPLRFDPAGSVFVVFRYPTRSTPHLSAVRYTSSAPVKSTQPKLEILKAYYEGTNGERGADVTAKVSAMASGGETSIPATNGVFGDPLVNIPKRLRVQYRLNGKPMEKIVAENETLELGTTRDENSFPAYELASTASGRAELLPWQPGRYDVKTGATQVKSVTVREKPQTANLSGPWSLSFPPGQGAPSGVQLPRLISWSEHSVSGVKYFSGTATYRKEFTLLQGMAGSGRVVSLDLGRVKNFAEVSLNGKSLGILWKAPFRLDVTPYVKPGRNTLVVRVTNLWPNRLIGDEQYPDDVQWNGATLARWPDWLLNGQPRPEPRRHTFATWKFYNKDSPLLESGLIGPVVLRSVKPILLNPS